MKWNEFIDWLCIIVIALMMLVLSSCSDKPETLPPTATFTTGLGATVYVIQGPNPTQSDLIEIDRQITRITEIANSLDRGYVWPTHRDHVIELILPSPDCLTPGSFQIPAGQYGSGLICVAGKFEHRDNRLDTNRIRTTLTAIRTMKIVQYESEHYGLKLNDRLLYDLTLTHVPPNGHPIFGVE